MTDPVFFQGDEVRDVRPFLLEVDFEPGNYIREIGDIENKTLVLITDTHEFDGIAHSVDAAGLNEEFKNTGWKIKVDDLISKYERVFKGSEVRKEQQQLLIGRVQDYQREIALLADRRPQPPQAMLAAPTTTEEAAESRNVLVAYQEEIKQFQNEIAVVNDKMTLTTRQLTNVMNEQAALLTAQARTSTKQIDKINDAVYSLQSFTLDNSATKQLTKGASAPKDEPLTLYQSLLFVDEELMVHADVGGGHHRDPDMIGKAIEEDPTFLTRLIPAKRGAVLMQFSRNTDRYNRPKLMTYRALMELAEEFEADKARILLTRDGDNVFFTALPEKVWRNTNTLFPNEREFDKIFGGWGGQQINFQDLAYVKARDEFETISQSYRRLLLIIAGLQLNHKVFGPIEDINPMNLTKEAYHKSNVRYIRDAEEGLINPKTPFRTWMKQVTTNVSAGETIWLSGPAMHAHWHVPALARYSEREDKTYLDWEIAKHHYTLDDKWIKCVVEGSANDPYVTLTFRYRGYNNRNREVEDRKARVYIDRTPTKFSKEWTNYDDERVKYLRIDFVLYDDVFYYLNDRKARYNFHFTHPILKALHKHIKNDPIYRSFQHGSQKGATLLKTDLNKTLTAKHPNEIYTAQHYNNAISRYVEIAIDPRLSKEPKVGLVRLNANDKMPTTADGISDVLVANPNLEELGALNFHVFQYKKHKEPSGQITYPHHIIDRIKQTFVLKQSEAIDLEANRAILDALEHYRFEDLPEHFQPKSLVDYEINKMEEYGHGRRMSTLVIPFGMVYCEGHGYLRQAVAQVPVLNWLMNGSSYCRDQAERIFNLMRDPKWMRESAVKPLEVTRTLHSATRDPYLTAGPVDGSMDTRGQSLVGDDVKVNDEGRTMKDDLIEKAMYSLYTSHNIPKDTY